MNTTIIAICVICLIISVLLDNKFDIPLGITSMLSALVICWFGFEMPAGKVIGGFFPSTIVFPLMLAMIYFTVFTSNGTSEIVAHKVMSLIRGNMRWYPWILFFLCIPLYVFFDAGALRYVIAPLVFAVAKAGNGNTLMAISTAYMPLISGSLNPYIGIDASTRIGILTDMGLENSTNVGLAVWLICLILTFTVQLTIYILTGSWKVESYEFKGSDEKHELTTEQKKSFGILAVTVVAFVLPPLLKALIPGPATAHIASLFSNYTVFCLGILMVILFGLGDWRGLVSKVSLKPILMIIGVTLLIKTAQEAGLQELCVSFVNMVPEWLVAPMLMMIGALLSFFVAGPTILPMLYPMVGAMATSPAEAIVFLACTSLGIAAAGISPISNNGVALLSTIDISEHDKYSKYMFIMAGLGPLIMAIVSATGLLGKVAAAFAGWYY